MNRVQCSLRKLEVVINVADEHQINRIWRKLGRILLADHADDVLHLLLVSGFLDVVHKFLCNVHGINLPRSSDRRRNHSSEEAGSRPDIGHGHSRFQFQCGDDFLAMIKDIPAIRFEALNGFRDIRMLVGLVDAGIHALFLSVEQSDGETE